MIEWLRHACAVFAARCGIQVCSIQPGYCRGYQLISSYFHLCQILEDRKGGPKERGPATVATSGFWRLHMQAETCRKSGCKAWWGLKIFPPMQYLMFQKNNIQFNCNTWNLRSVVGGFTSNNAYNWETNMSSTYMVASLRSFSPSCRDRLEMLKPW